MATTVPPYAIVYGPDANCTLDICPIDASVYGYRPDIVTNSVFVGFYAVCGILHTYLGFRFQKWFFTGCMVIGCTSIVIGYIGRVLMCSNPWDFTGFIIQIICVGAGPIYYCAAIYVTLALTVETLDASLSRFKPKYFYYTFIPGDLLSLGFQSAGGAISSTTSGGDSFGVDLSLFGLAFQLFMITVFSSLMIDYLIRFYRSGQWVNLTLRIKIFIVNLGLATALITARSSYRFVELHAGYQGSYLLILLSTVCLLAAHPGMMLGSTKAIDQTDSSDSYELVEN